MILRILPPNSAIGWSAASAGSPRRFEVRDRDDAAGHNYGPGDPQDRGPHFNDPAGNHYDYWHQSGDGYL
jgi:hypothetical protein